MEHKGWIKLHRKIMDSNMYKSLNAVQRDVMMQCLLHANHKSNKWEWNGEIYECKPGQFITSLDSLKRSCAKGTSTKNVRTALSKLEKWEFLTSIATKTGRLITVCKWYIYQGQENENGKQDGNEMAKKWQRNGKEVAPNKNNERMNENEEDNENIKTAIIESYIYCTTMILCKILDLVIDNAMKYFLSELINKYHNEENLIQRYLLLCYVINKKKGELNISNYKAYLTNGYKETSYQEYKNGINNVLNSTFNNPVMIEFN